MGDSYCPTTSIFPPFFSSPQTRSGWVGTNARIRYPYCACTPLLPPESAVSYQKSAFLFLSFPLRLSFSAFLHPSLFLGLSFPVLDTILDYLFSLSV